MNKLDMYKDLPDTRYRIVFHLPMVGWVRGWVGDSYLEGCQQAGELSAYDVRILRNDTDEIVYERPSQFVVKPIGSDS